MQKILFRLINKLSSTISYQGMYKRATVEVECPGEQEPLKYHQFHLSMN